MQEKGLALLDFLRTNLKDLQMACKLLNFDCSGMDHEILHLARDEAELNIFLRPPADSSVYVMSIYVCLAIAAQFGKAGDSHS